jgi:hypothetical protein|tara:strand:+ start:2236 stop:2439 length:204 start_codon:yes stop_codon:yes gene_type:complete
MDLEQLLGIYVDKFGEENDINTVILSDEGQEKLIDMVTKAISNNEPISKKELQKLFGFDPDKSDILI